MDGSELLSANRCLSELKAPFAPMHTGTIASLVHWACRRAGVTVFGPHRLRHAVACTLLGEGASLEEIGQLLRQRDQTTTAVYAKGDLARLSTLAMPCPQAAVRCHQCVSAQEYLTMRRALGYRLLCQGRLLLDFADQMDHAGQTRLTMRAALAWAAQSPDTMVVTHRLRLSVVRYFARHLAT